MSWREQFRALHWVVIVQYYNDERRAVGPFDDFGAASAWVNDNRSDLWDDHDILALEDLTPSRIFSSGDGAEDHVDIKW